MQGSSWAISFWSSCKASLELKFLCSPFAGINKAYTDSVEHVIFSMT